MNELSVIPDSKELVRQSTDIAHLCREIVVASSLEIEKRKYVRVEGWQAIATAHGCVASARDVRRVEGGMIATGEIRRMQDGQLIATAEGFVGEDEPTWYGGKVEKDEWIGPKGNRKKTGKRIVVDMPKRPEYAIRAMAQTRAISRACRGCFAHVVVLMNAGLSTTPAEEVPEGGFNDHYDNPAAPKEEPQSSSAPEPAPIITDDQAKAGNIHKLRALLEKERGEHSLTDYEASFCLVVKDDMKFGMAYKSLDEFTLDILRSIWPKRNAYCAKIAELYASATKP